WDATEEDAGQWRQAQENPCQESGSEVQNQVHEACRESRSQIRLQLLATVLEPKHEKEQEHTYIGADMDEILRESQRRKPAVPERQSGKQIKRDCRHAPVAREA